MSRLIGILVLLALLVTVLIPVATSFSCRRPRPQLTPTGEQATTYTVNLYVNETGEVLALDLEQYLVGVVAAELPANFHAEALKAGAVAARTYTVRRLRDLGGIGCSRHPDADICDDPGHHQAWLSDEQLRARWGFFFFPINHARIRRAVRETTGQILTVNGQPIDALYHSTCGGKTECAEEVWGQPVPYLVPVVCEWDRHSPRSTTTTSVSRERLRSAFGRDIDPGDISVASRTATGRARTISVGGTLLSGERFRSLLGLTSAWVDLSLRDGQLEVTARGFGHGVGMCQYGADGLGRSGAEYVDILNHYYTGVSLEYVDDIEQLRSDQAGQSPGD